MPYYVFRVETAELAMLKQLELIETFDKFKLAKNRARDLRTEVPEGEKVEIKVIFAENQLAAEEMLMEKRDKPIVMEHEK